MGEFPRTQKSTAVTAGQPTVEAVRLTFMQDARSVQPQPRAEKGGHQTGVLGKQKHTTRTICAARGGLERNANFPGVFTSYQNRPHASYSVLTSAPSGDWAGGILEHITCYGHIPSRNIQNQQK